MERDTNPSASGLALLEVQSEPWRMLGSGTGILGQCSQAQGGTGGMSVQGQELDLMIPVGPAWDIL